MKKLNCTNIADITFLQSLTGNIYYIFISLHCSPLKFINSRLYLLHLFCPDSVQLAGFKKVYKSRLEASKFYPAPLLMTCFQFFREYLKLIHDNLFVNDTMGMSVGKESKQ